MKESKRKSGRGRSPFLVACDEKGGVVCEYVVYDMGKGKKAILPISPRLEGYFHKLMKGRMRGVRKVTWRGVALSRLNTIISLGWDNQEMAFYRVFKPLISGAKRGRRDEVLRRIGVLKERRLTYRSGR